MREGDFVTELLGLVESACGSIDRSALDRIEEQIRANWGGIDVYIPKRRPIHERKIAALQDWRNGVPIAQASTTHGIDRSTLYRLINRRRSS